VTAVPKNILQSYVDVLQGLDLKPLAVDIPANSTAKFLTGKFSQEIWMNIIPRGSIKSGK